MKLSELIRRLNAELEAHPQDPSVIVIGWDSYVDEVTTITYDEVFDCVEISI